MNVKCTRNRLQVTPMQPAASHPFESKHQRSVRLCAPQDNATRPCGNEMSAHCGAPFANGGRRHAGAATPPGGGACNTRRLGPTQGLIHLGGSPSEQPLPLPEPEQVQSEHAASSRCSTSQTHASHRLPRQQGQAPAEAAVPSAVLHASRRIWRLGSSRK